MIARLNHQRDFLDVTRSLSGRRWVDRLPPHLDPISRDIAQRTGLDDLIARLLASRGIDGDSAAVFMNPSIKNLMPDPYVLQDMERAAERIASSIIAGDKIAIFGDYDVDGATSSALLYRFLSHYGLKPRLYIPDRLIEGYGPNPTAMKTLIEEGAQLIVTVDCGVTSFEALQCAHRWKVDVVVLDHHQMGPDLPIAHAIVNANRLDDQSQLGHLAAVGTTLMAAIAIHRLLRNHPSFSERANGLDLLKLLDLVALGTICDVVPMKTLNRAFVSKGLIAMRRLENVGIAALSQVAQVDGPLAPYHVGFLLGPRINAGGRVGNAALGAKLLTLDEPNEARILAERLDRLNGERQMLEKSILDEADAQAFAEIDAYGEEPAVIITSGDGWHAGVLGIVAARLKERYGCPAFVIGFDKQGKGTGSARSVHGVDLGSAVRAAVEVGILQQGGGHAMAAGCSLARNRLGDLRAFLEERLADDVRAMRVKNYLTIDGALTARAATLSLIAGIEQAGPYGMGHPAPVFAFPAHRLTYSKIVGQGHVKIAVRSADGASLSGIAFRSADQALGRGLLQRRGELFHLAGVLDKNSWQGKENVQLRLLDAAPVDQA